MIKKEKISFITIISVIIIAFIGCEDTKDLEPKLSAKDINIDATFSIPESFLSDNENEVFYISNIGDGDPFEEDDNGYIIKLDKNYKVIDNYFINGADEGIELHSPKGLYVKDDMLIVPDLGYVRVFSTNNGELIENIDFTLYKTGMLNDVAGDDEGNIYVSDLFSTKIYIIDNDFNVDVWIDGLDGPNGLFFSEGYLYILTNTNGGLYRVPIDNTEAIEKLVDTPPGVDGLYLYNDVFYISNWATGEVYTYNLFDDTFEVIIDSDTFESTADLSVDTRNNLLLIPLFWDDSYFIYDLD